VYKHANGPPSRLARITGDKRCSKEPREGTSARKHRTGLGVISRSPAFTFAQLFRPARIPCPAGPLEQCRSWGQRLSGLWGSPLEGERRGIQRVARCGASSSNLLCIQKRKNRAALRAHRAWQRLQGQPLQRARTALARIRARVSYFENFVSEVEGLRLAQRSIRINMTSGCARGPSRGNRVCKRNAISQRRNGAVRRRVGGKTNESRTGSRHRVHSRWRAANVARRRPKKCTLRWKSCRIAERRGLHGSRRAAL